MLRSLKALYKYTYRFLTIFSLIKPAAGIHHWEGKRDTQRRQRQKKCVDTHKHIQTHTDTDTHRHRHTHIHTHTRARARTHSLSLTFIMTRFRLGISDIPVYYYWSKRHTDKDLICPLCRVAQETELYFVLCCPVLRTLRAQFITLKIYKFPSLFRLSLLLASTNKNSVRNPSCICTKPLSFKHTVIVGT